MESKIKETKAATKNITNHSILPNKKDLFFVVNPIPAQG